MIDFHTHILPGIDDGAKNYDQAIKIIQQAKAAGFTDVILTPHYIEEYYEADEQARKSLMEQLQKEADINLYLGNELYITRNIEELLKSKKISTINNSKYVLMELPFNNKVIYLNEVIYKLISLGKVPIIAHPERYEYIQENPDVLEELIEDGVLFQMNYGSIIGQYGKKAQKTAKYLLKKGYINFLGSDTHRMDGIYLKLDKALKKIEKIIGKESLYEITEKNPKCVLENQDIE